MSLQDKLSRQLAMASRPGANLNAQAKARKYRYLLDQGTPKQGLGRQAAANANLGKMGNSSANALAGAAPKRMPPNPLFGVPGDDRKYKPRRPKLPPSGSKISRRPV